MDREQLTRQVAYWLYLHRGRAPGDPVHDWTTAERIVDLVLAMVTAWSEPTAEPEATPEPCETESSAEPEPVLDPAGVALELLQAFLVGATRAEAASRLGYKSASTVGKILRGQRRMSDDLIERIQAAFGAPARKAA